MHIRYSIAIIVVAWFSFAFGWTARGDSIYSGMFKERVDVVEDLAVAISPKTKRKATTSALP
jgi:hypothetical protein